MAGNGDSINFRIKDINTFINKTKHGKNIIFMGDTNARQDDFNKTELKEYYKDAWETCGNKNNKYTVDGFNNPFFPDGFQYKSRYDRAYYTHNIICNTFLIIFDKSYNELIEHTKTSGCISDHYGIYCKFNLPNTTTTDIVKNSKKKSNNINILYSDCKCVEECRISQLEIILDESEYNERCFYDDNNSLPWGYNKYSPCNINIKLNTHDLQYVIYDKLYIRITKNHLSIK